MFSPEKNYAPGACNEAGGVWSNNKVRCAVSVCPEQGPWPQTAPGDVAEAAAGDSDGELMIGGVEGVMFRHKLKPEWYLERPAKRKNQKQISWAYDHCRAISDKHQALDRAKPFGAGMAIPLVLSIPDRASITIFHSGVSVRQVHRCV